MKIVVIGGTGLIGSKLVNKLGQLDHTAIAASPDTGVNTITGEGLNEALKDADVVVDVSNSPSFEDKAVMDFFQSSTINLLAAATQAKVKYYVALYDSTRRPTSGKWLSPRKTCTGRFDQKIRYPLLHSAFHSIL